MMFKLNEVLHMSEGIDCMNHFQKVCCSGCYVNSVGFI